MVEFWSIFHTMFLISLLLNLLDNQTTLTLISPQTSLLTPVLESFETGTNFITWCVEDFWKEKSHYSTTLNSWVTSHAFMTTQSSIEANQFSFYQTPNYIIATINVNFGFSGLHRSYYHPYFSLFYELILFILALVNLRWFKIM